MKKLKILTEASGSLTSSYLAKAIREAGHIVCGSDINDFNRAYYDDFILMPRADDPQLWDKTLRLLQEHSIDMVIPTLDESLLGWSERVEFFAKYGILVLISPPHTISTFIDKWKTYEFFTTHNIPTPHTALYEPKRILKPRYGRGGSGIDYIQQEKYYGGGQNEKESLYLTQEEVKGQEYTIDCLFNPNGEIIYIIPRKRIGITQGKSTKGEVCYVKCLESYIHTIASQIQFLGAINIQAFITSGNKPMFIEINPRLGGGSALGFAASENWITAMIEMFVYKQNITAKPIKYGLKMARSYQEIYF